MCKLRMVERLTNLKINHLIITCVVLDPSQSHGDLIQGSTKSISTYDLRNTNSQI